MTKWTIDQAHSNIAFQVKHMMVSKVKGSFSDYTADVEAADLADLTNARIHFTINVDSLTTKNEERDNHLKSADFFDAETYPHMTFTSTSITKSGSDYKLTGDFTIRDQTHPVTFDVEYNGKVTNPWGVEVHGFEAETTIKREQFGLTWNAALETGGVLVSSDVKISLDLEFNPASE